VSLSAQDVLLAATLCPGLSAERWVPALVAAALEPPQPALFGPPGDARLASVSPAGTRAAARAAWAAFLAGPASEAVAMERAELQRLGARAVTPLCPEWPAELPPEGVLRVRGTLGPGPRVALVGSRRADRYGRDVTERAARAAAAAGVAVVSGGALGTDGFAHEACLAAGGRTLVVLGSGLSHPSPTTHLDLFERAAASGAVVSPFPCHVTPSRFTFPRRNAWIAGLSAVTVVLQAGATSGALHTARAAAALGRPVYALPGPIDSPLQQGAHALLAAGARVLDQPDAWRREGAFLSVGVDKSATARTIAGRATADPDAIPPFGLVLWRAAGAEPVPLASLAEEAGLTAGDAAALALQLELAGWLRAEPGGRFARRTP
jgi:DNA processing protein